MKYIKFLSTTILGFIHSSSALILLCIIFTATVICWDTVSFAESSDGTMLMFVGEEIDVVTVASRTPESPSTAPAVVRVIDRSEILKYGYATLAQLLSAEPGFYISSQGSGSLPYLRGIANGVLILYDGVPIPTSGNRSYYPLDYELSLNSVRQVEIIRGPGSVLWGPDAFAGIVNIVPMKAADLDNENGGELEFAAGSENTLKGFAAKGFKKDNWDAFISLYAAQNRFNSDSFFDLIYSEEDDRWNIADATIDDSRYYEMTFNLNYRDSFSFSGRFSDFKRPYTLNTFYETGSIDWPSEKKAPVNFFKINWSKTSGRSHWNLTGYYEDVSYSHINAESLVEEKADIFYGELLWDRRLFEKGLMTTGISFRENRVDGALLSGGFIPELLLDTGGFKQPSPIQKDYRNTLKSIFAQYRHPFAWGEFWSGFRLDDNSMYDDYATSYTMGLNVPVNNLWRIKTVFGTGYRTPYSLQLKEETPLTRDHIATLNIEAERSSGRGDSFSATLFCTRVSDNVQTDPYGWGVSEPSDHDYAGVELNYRKKINEKIEGYVSISRVFFSGDDYSFKVLRQSWLRPDGTTVDDYDEWTESYDPGADAVVSSGVVWSPYSFFNFSLNASWASAVPYSYGENTITGEYKNPLMVNSEMKFPELFKNNLILTVGCRNMLDGDFQYPGIYGPVDGEPLVIYGVVKYSF
ncbi:TonB-dependent receptor plug domain-containing protein [Desulfamplus magnetovallimortis]|uniref:TonB-dependent receptor plug domain-containing protein n=1 Tax=Desulfamplus magnetovallimortis TaxID=1246637 RepID=UPI00164480AF|nr:TonB-dependent receptor plug domain-containing protein [Desulfamplus magnetovallimortis]